MAIFDYKGQDTRVLISDAWTLATYTSGVATVGALYNIPGLVLGEGNTFALPKGWREIGASELQVDSSHTDITGSFTGDGVFGSQARVFGQYDDSGQLVKMGFSIAGTNSPIDLLGWPAMIDNSYINGYDYLLNSIKDYATDHNLSSLETARMLAMVDVSTVDALISCYQQKRHWSFWRPVTAIPLADTDGNPATVADPAWTPLRVTAPSPEWPSGHACYTSAIMTALRKFFGRDTLSFSAYSAESGTTRHYDSLSSARAELMEARIWAGVHYRGATVHGDRLGETVAREVLANEFGRRR